MMTPTDHEYTVATHAAAERVYKASCAEQPDVVFTDWADLEVPSKRPFLEAVLPIVDAALQALPERDLVSLAAERIGRAQISAMLTGADVRAAINADLDLVKAFLGEETSGDSR
jgi:hypothetical protein